VADRHKIFSFNEAAEYLGISPRTLRTWIKEGKIRSFKLGNLVKIHGKELKRFINRNRHHNAQKDRKNRKQLTLEIFRVLDGSPDLASQIFREEFPEDQVEQIAEKLAEWRGLEWQQALLKGAVKDLVYEIIEHSREDEETRDRYTS
jgi:excisionase family DNA binding protein